LLIKPSQIGQMAVAVPDSAGKWRYKVQLCSIHDLSAPVNLTTQLCLYLHGRFVRLVTRRGAVSRWNIIGTTTFLMSTTLGVRKSYRAPHLYCSQMRTGLRPGPDRALAPSRRNRPARRKKPENRQPAAGTPGRGAVRGGWGPTGSLSHPPPSPHTWVQAHPDPGPS
jgi:hypothetical protein